MAEDRTHMLMHHIDPRRNMRRFYMMTIQPNLFGGSSLIRAWGRIGTRGRQKVELFENEDTADRALDRLARIRQRRGYVVRPTGR